MTAHKKAPRPKPISVKKQTLKDLEVGARTGRNVKGGASGIPGCGSDACNSYVQTCSYRPCV